MGTAADVCNTNVFLRLLGGAPVLRFLRRRGGAPRLSSILLGGGSHEQSPPSNPSKAASLKGPGPGPSPRQLSDVNAFLPRPHGAAPAAGLGGVVGQGWGCSMVAVGDIGESVPRAGCP